MAYINGKRTVYCRNCYQKGHNRRSCPKLSPEMKARYATGDRARKCSYCLETGHTRPKCTARKSDMATYAQKNADYRRETLERMVSMGIGVGSLIYTGEPRDNLQPHDLYMIDRIEWEDVQAKQAHNYAFHGIPMTEEGYSNTFVMPPTENTHGWRKLNVLTRRPEIEIRSAIPSGWLDGTSGIERFFNKKRRY